MLFIIHWLLCNDYLWLYTYWHLQFWHSRRSRIHKEPPEVFLKTLQISQRSTCVGVSFLKSCKPSGLNVTKQDSYAGVSLWNLRNSEEHLFWSISERLLLCIITSSYIDFYSTSFSFLQISSSLWRNWDNRTNDAWGGFLWKSISLNKIFSFWKLKISFTEMFHESVKKQFSWNLL